MDVRDLPLVLNDHLQVPLHSLSRNLRNQQKTHEQGANVALKAIRDLLQRVSAKEGSGETVAPEKIAAALDKITSKLVEVKEQTRAASADMQATLESLTFRVAMRNGSLPPPVDTHDSKRARPSNESASSSSPLSFSGGGGGRMIDLAVISNYLLRTGRFETFKTLCRESNCEFLASDVEVFKSHAAIHKALEMSNHADLALAWCQENRSALKKKQSNFEFELRLRQFCELVESGQLIEAVQFARKHMASNVSDERMRKAMAMLAFPIGSLHESPYEQLVSRDCWTALASEFARVRNEVLSLNSVTVLETLVRIGLAVIKTQSCCADGPGKAAGCPACQPSLGRLATRIPRTMRERSYLVCRLSGGLMEDPLVLPNGQAYSKAALEQMAASRGDGKVCCPVTHQEFSLKDCKRAFII